MNTRVFSAIQPTGHVHLGNYLGAIRQWVALQVEHACLFCIADLHAITTLHEPARLQAMTREVAALLVAAGVDPVRSPLFVQSQVSAHAELAWLLLCVIPMGWLQRMIQYKSTVAQGHQQVSVGLFTYSALMAADILLYAPDYVPVGTDQQQHLELTRDVAQRFHSLYGQTFTLPQPLIPTLGARIMGLDMPTQKMSKSVTRPGHALYLLDPPEVIHTKLMRATTDSMREIRFDPARPGIFNLLTLYELFTGDDRATIEARFAGKGYADLKRELAEAVIATLQPLQARYRTLIADPAYLDTLLADGAAHVSPLAAHTLAFAKERIGLG